MDKTQHLGLPYIAASQAQKHVTHNEALERLDALVQLAVLDRDLTEPPSSPAAGARFIIAAGATGLWAGKTGQIAHWTDGFWDFLIPQAGWSCWLVDENTMAFYNGTGWQLVTSNILPTTTSQLGVNTASSAVNRLAVASATTLFTHEGAGHQLKLNKAQAGDTASLLYQTGFSGRAEIGLTGDDNLHLKVSANGTSWYDALVVDRNSGVVSFPNTPFGGVASVAGRTGTVTLSAADISGLGTAAGKNAGTAAGNVVALDASAKLPAVDGSQITNLALLNLPNGLVIDRASAELTAYTNSSATIPVDDTPPQNNEGVLVLSASITPKAPTHRLRVRCLLNIYCSATTNIVLALFVNGETSARRAVVTYNPGWPVVNAIEYEFIAGAIAPQTITLRVGAGSGTMFFNGFSSVRYMGGVAGCSMTVEEIKA